MTVSSCFCWVSRTMTRLFTIRINRGKVECVAIVISTGSPIYSTNGLLLLFKNYHKTDQTVSCKHQKISCFKIRQYFMENFFRHSLSRINNFWKFVKVLACFHLSIQVSTISVTRFSGLIHLCTIWLSALVTALLFQIKHEYRKVWRFLGSVIFISIDT